MFEDAEAGHKLNKAEYEKEVPKLREALLNAQYDLVERAACQVIVLFSGMGGGGRGATANRLNEWLDPRHILTYAFGKRTKSNASGRRRGATGKHCRRKGSSASCSAPGIRSYSGRWTVGRVDNGDLQRALRDIRHFETMLAGEARLLVKIWLHLSREDQRQRLRDLDDDPRTRWRVTDETSRN